MEFKIHLRDVAESGCSVPAAIINEARSRGWESGFFLGNAGEDADEKKMASIALVEMGVPYYINPVTGRLAKLRDGKIEWSEGSVVEIVFPGPSEQRTSYHAMAEMARAVIDGHHGAKANKIAFVAYVEMARENAKILEVVKADLRSNPDHCHHHQADVSFAAPQEKTKGWFQRLLSFLWSRQ